MLKVHSVAGVDNSLSLVGHIGSKIIYGGQYKNHGPNWNDFWEKMDF